MVGNPAGDDSTRERVTRLVLEVAQGGDLDETGGSARRGQTGSPGSTALDPRLSLRDDLAVESLALLSLVLRLADELEVDVVEAGVDLSNLYTVGDLLDMDRALTERARQNARPLPTTTDHPR